MPSFRSADKQAQKAVSKLLSLGSARHSNKHDGRIHSVGTARAYSQALAGMARWLRDGRRGDLRSLTVDLANEYLAMRAEQVGQSTLDLGRQAVQAHLHATGQLRADARLARVRSEITTALQSRAYTTQQAHMIAARQSARNALATIVALESGARAHELLTLTPAAERGPSSHRQWSNDRFSGRDGWVPYTVAGKGGLIREIALSPETAARLEKTRLDQPAPITDRGVRYTTRYDIGGGNSWSASYTRVSQHEMGWSSGAHGLRHTYAQTRVDELQSLGCAYAESLKIVSQEMGHFRADITEVYLR